jgi:hypothetical protein
MLSRMPEGHSHKGLHVQLSAQLYMKHSSAHTAYTLSFVLLPHGCLCWSVKTVSV